MHDLEGELVSLRGTTWRVPIEGTPEVVDPGEEIAFGIAPTGGIPHTILATAHRFRGIRSAKSHALRAKN